MRRFNWDKIDEPIARPVIDPLGKAYSLVGGPVTLDKLLLRPRPTAPLVPDEWIALFDDGGRAVHQRRPAPAGQPAGGCR